MKKQLSKIISLALSFAMLLTFTACGNSSETTVSEAVSSQEVSSVADSSQATSSQATSSQATSSQATSSQATSSQATSSQATSSQATSSQAVSSQANSSQAVSSQAASSQAASSQAASSQATSSQATSSQSASSQVVSSQVTSSQATSSQATSSQTQTGPILNFDNEKGDGLKQNASQESSKTSNTASSTDSGSGTTVEEKVEFDANDPFANIPKRLRGSTVTFACWGDEGHDKYQKVYKAFTQKTGINVKIQNIDQKGYESTVMQRIAAGNAPDVVVDCYNFANMLEVLQPVENLVDIKDKFWDQDIIKISTVNGHTYGLSSLKSNWSGHKFIVYNKKLFEANSVMSPGDYYKRGKWSYENALKCMRDITKISGNYGGLISPFLMAASIGTPVVSYNTSKQTFVNNIKSSNVLAAYQYYATIKEEHIWETGMWYNHFNNGNVGIYDSDVWSIKFNGRFAKFDDNSLSAVPMPTSYKGKAAKQVGVYRAYCIAKNAKNPEGGAYFLRWFLDYQNYKDAGVEVYKNKNLEDFYYNIYIPLVEKEGINYSFYETAMAYMGQDVNTYIQADDSGKAQVNGLLNSKSNEVDAAVKALNEKIKKR